MVLSVLCLSKTLNPDVLMMEPAEDWYRSDAAGLLRPPKIQTGGPHAALEPGER
jgi:hypothetical protein